MRHRVGFLVRTILLAAIAMAWHGDATAQVTKISRVYEDGLGNSLPYQLFLPPGYNVPGNEFPLLLHLHGAGERGTDNTRQTLFIDNMINETQTDHPAFLLVPQAAPNDGWSHFSSDGLSTSAQLTLDVMADLEGRFAIDTSRRYITGLSMGGFGTYDIVAKHPDMFVAAAPIAGYGDPAQAANYLNTRLWGIHGSEDDVVAVEPHRAMIQAIRDAGGDPLYTELPVGHNAWSTMYDDASGEFYDWLFDGVQPAIVDLLYDPATGTVQFDASQAPGGEITQLTFALDRSSPLYDPTKLMTAPEFVYIDGAAVPAADVIQVRGGTRFIFTGATTLTGTLQIPGLMPAGYDFSALSDLTYGQYYYSPQTGGTRRYFSLKTGAIAAVPEPATWVLASAGLGLLAWRRRRAALR